MGEAGVSPALSRNGNGENIAKVRVPTISVTRKPPSRTRGNGQ